MKKKTIISRITGALDDSLRRKPWAGSSNKLAGHCYVASEAAYHLLGGSSSKWKPMFIRHEGSPHWFLRSSDGEILDITASQFSSPVPYEKARGNGFLTSHPSRRASIVINKVMESI